MHGKHGRNAMVFALLLVPTLAFAQAVKEVKAKTIWSLSFSAEGEQNFKKDYELFEKVINKMSNQTKEDQLTADEKRVYNEMGETNPDYWQTLGHECSWYCGGGADEIIASSSLKSQDGNTYVVRNIHDFSYKNAWVEGVPGYGIGEYVTYKFSGNSPRITDVIVVNGYVKSEEAYVENSRVKRLKMYLNDEPYAILNLEDKRSSQRFEFEPIGNGNRSDSKALNLQPAWTLKFEILEVYKGTKYDDVVISEIYFDGIDVH